MPYKVNSYGKSSKISDSFLFLFSNKMMVIRAGIHKLLIRIAYVEDPDLGLPCLSRHYRQATSVRNFRTFTIFGCLQTAFSAKTEPFFSTEFCKN